MRGHGQSLPRDSLFTTFPPSLAQPLTLLMPRHPLTLYDSALKHLALRVSERQDLASLYSLSPPALTLSFVRDGEGFLLRWNVTIRADLEEQTLAGFRQSLGSFPRHLSTDLIHATLREAVGRQVRTFLQIYLSAVFEIPMIHVNWSDRPFAPDLPYSHIGVTCKVLIAESSVDAYCTFGLFQ